MPGAPPESGWRSVRSRAILPPLITVSRSLEGPGKHKLIILGTRTFAEEVADLVSDSDEYALEAFGENWERERCGRPLVGRPVIWVDELAPLAAPHYAVCAIGTPQRSRFVDQAARLGFRFAILRHPAARGPRAAGPGGAPRVRAAARRAHA